MMRSPQAAILLTLLFAMAPGCGEPDCGPGTMLVNGQCAPSADRCGEGTVWNASIGQCEGAICARGTELIGGECVPDGSVICDSGTIYDPESGTCSVDVVGCGPGTVLVAGQCIPEDDALQGFVKEPAEPNEGSFAHPINAPADGAPTTISGCITPAVDLDLDGDIDPDFDDYVFEMPGPGLLRVTVDGIGGLAGGFSMTSRAREVAADGWHRAGVSLVGDTVSRTVFVPASGPFVLSVGDSRAILLDTPAGGEDTCYVVTVERIPGPSSEPLTDETTLALDGARFLDFQPSAHGAVLELDASDSSAAAGVGVAVVANGRYVSSATSDGGPISVTAGGLMSDHSVVVVVEPAFSYSLEEVSATLLSAELGSAPLLSGAATTVAHQPGGNLLWLETPLGSDILGLDLVSADAAIELRLLDRNLGELATLCDGTPPCTSASAVAQLPSPGPYYVEVVNPLNPAPGSEYDVFFDSWFRAPEPLAVNAPIAGRALGSLGADFYQVTIDDLTWLVTTGAATDFGGTLRVEWYPRSTFGVLGDGVPVLADHGFAVGDESYPRIVEVAPAAEPAAYLLRVIDDGFDGTADTETYDLAVSERNALLVDLNVGGYSDSAVAFEAGEEKLYLVTGETGTRALAGVTGAVGVDLRIVHLGTDEGDVRVADDGGAAGDETLGAFLRGVGWAAFAVREVGGVAGAADLSIAEEGPDLTFATNDDLIAPDDGGAVTGEVDVPDSCTLDAVRLDYATFGAAPSATLEANFEAPGGLDFDLAPGVVNFAGSVPGHYDPMDDWTAFDAHAGTSATGTWSLSIVNPSNVPGTGVSSWTLNLFCE